MERIARYGLHMTNPAAQYETRTNGSVVRRLYIDGPTGYSWIQILSLIHI